MPYADPVRRRAHATAYCREKRKENPEPFRERCRKSYHKHREDHHARGRAKYAKLKADPVAYAAYLKGERERRRERYKTDPVFRIYCNARSKITCALKRGGNQKTGTTESLTGCTILELKAHLESQFKDGMSWENKHLWHIDHKRSCASFDLSDPAQVQKCFHYSNLQPLWGKENREKWANFEGYHHCSARNRKRNQRGQFIAT